MSRPLPPGVRAVRLGHGANCSSIGSVVDGLFLAATAGGALFAAVLAALPPPRPDAPVARPRRSDANDDPDADAALDVPRGDPW